MTWESNKKVAALLNQGMEGGGKGSSPQRR